MSWKHVMKVLKIHHLRSILVKTPIQMCVSQQIVITEEHSTIFLSWGSMIEPCVYNFIMFKIYALLQICIKQSLHNLTYIPKDKEPSRIRDFNVILIWALSIKFSNFNLNPLLQHQYYAMHCSCMVHKLTTIYSSLQSFLTFQGPRVE